MLSTQTIISSVLLIILVGGALYYFSHKSSPSSMEQSSSSQQAVTGSVVTLKTTKGDIVIQLHPDKAPVSAANFAKLASSGFYNGVKFHRVIPNFMIQAGDPNTKGSDVSTYGMGGPGYTIADEFNNGLSNTRGTVAMANTGRPHSGGSQFFINVVDNSKNLDGGYSVFGTVTSGMDVADAIVSVPTTGEMPTDPIVIESVEVK